MAIDHEFFRNAAAWATRPDSRRALRSHAPGETLKEAASLLEHLGTKGDLPPPTPLDDDSLEVLHAACLILRERSGEPDNLQRAQVLYEHLLACRFPDPDFQERTELLTLCCFAAWRSARVIAPASAFSWRTRYETAANIRSGPSDPIALDAVGRAITLKDSESLLGACGFLRQRLEATPSVVLEAVVPLHSLLLAGDDHVEIPDEREFFLGETALIAGNACRQTSRRPEAHRWFDRAESAFHRTAHGDGDLLRVAYQRLAELFEERQIESVRERLPFLSASFRAFGMDEDLLKCRFLEGIALMETERLSEAAALFKDVAREASALGNARLEGMAFCNLTHIYGSMGDVDGAREWAARAVPALLRDDNQVALAKVHWGLAALLRETGQLAASVDAYRQAQREFEAIGMRADVAALKLVVADLLLQQGEDREARKEIVAALPAISELKMAPEAVAALALLRESVRGKELDRQALDELRGYLEKLQG